LKTIFNFCISNSVTKILQSNFLHHKLFEIQIPTKIPSIQIHFPSNHNQLASENLVKPAYFLFSDKHPLIKRWNTAIRANDAFIRRTIHKYFHDKYKTGKIPRCPTTDSEISEAKKPLSEFFEFVIASKE
jgi:hypothetical protein